MGKIFIVRHGQDEDNANGILNGRRNKPLTILGREQAGTVAEKLHSYKIDVIYSSPLKRAFETAQIIASRLKRDNILIHEHLIEREFGILSGKPISDIPLFAKKILKTDRVNYFLEAEGAEKFSDLYERAQKILHEIKEKHAHENVLVVAHGDIGKMMRAVHHKWTWREGLKKPYFENTGILELNDSQDKIQ